MSEDAFIFFRRRGERKSAELKAKDWPFIPPLATDCLSSSPGNGWYWSPDSQRGSWEALMSTLTDLIMAYGEGNVWYCGGDATEPPPPFTKQDLLAYTKAYLEIDESTPPVEGSLAWKAKRLESNIALLARQQANSMHECLRWDDARDLALEIIRLRARLK